MRKFLIWIFVVIITVVIVDFSLGYLFKNYLSSHTLPGDYESVEKVLRHNDSDILVLGSSVALNSINTKTLEDSLGLSAFDGGGNGQTFPFFLTMLKGAISTHIPKIVILCVQPSALTGHGVGERYNFLTPYYGEGISDIDLNMDSLKKHNDLFMKSSLYKLNTIWFRVLLYFFITPDIRGENGHIAKPEPPSFPIKQSGKIEHFSDERLIQLKEFINVCKKNDIELVLLFTPLYTYFENLGESNNVIEQTSNLASEYGFKTFNDIALEPFASNPELFYDNSHININGTKIYTDTIINRLKPFLHEK